VHPHKEVTGNGNRISSAEVLAFRHLIVEYRSMPRVMEGICVEDSDTVRLCINSSLTIDNQREAILAILRAYMR
jgi:hypothetical protein